MNTTSHHKILIVGGSIFPKKRSGHQAPGFLDVVANKKAELVRIYLPPDANTLLPVTDHCLRSRNYVNVIMACCGDVPTLETLAAVNLMRTQFPELKIRVINVVDLMKLQPQSEHPHGLSDADFDALFSTDKPIIFAHHGYPMLIHRLTYRRTNHRNLHVHGFKEEGSTSTPFVMVVMNKLDRFHLVIDVIQRVPQVGEKGAHLKQWLEDKLIEHQRYIEQNGQDLPEIRNWKWDTTK